MDPIPELLTKILESWFWGHYSSTEIKNEQDKTRRPSNADAVIPVQINEELYHSISPDGKFLDRPFRYIQNALGKGAQPLVSVWYKIIQCQNILKKQNPDKSCTFTVGHLHIDFAELRELLVLSLRLIGMASSQLAIQHRLDLGNFVAPGFHKLCEEHVPFTRWMFTENVKTQIEDTSKINRMVDSANRKLAPSTAPGYNRMQKAFLFKKLGKHG